MHFASTAASDTAQEVIPKISFAFAGQQVVFTIDLHDGLIDIEIKPITRSRFCGFFSRRTSDMQLLVRMCQKHLKKTRIRGSCCGITSSLWLISKNPQNFPFEKNFISLDHA